MIGFDLPLAPGALLLAVIMFAIVYAVVWTFRKVIGESRWGKLMTFRRRSGV